MGCVYSRGAIKWIKYRGVDGRLHYESSGSEKVKVAERLLKLREGDIEHGVPVTPKIGRVTFNEAAEDLLTDYRVHKRPSLEDAEIRIEKHLRPVFGGRLLTSIMRADIVKYQAQRQAEGAANGTINRELTTLKRMFSLAREGGKLLHAPKIPLLSEEGAVRTGFFERELFDSVISHLPKALRPVAAFGYHTGWRRGEILNLQWRQVDRRAGEVRLDPGTTKNREGRMFPYGEFPTLRELIEAQWQAHEQLKAKGILSPWVFPRLRGAKPGDRIGSFRKAWATACKRAGCPGRLFHDLRRTAVRNLVRAGVPEKVAMTLTGHKTRAVFERYNIVSDGDVRAAVRRLGDSFGDSQPAASTPTAQNSQNPSRKSLRARSSGG